MPFSNKLRTLLNGILRDILAGVFLIAFGLFSKTDPTKLDQLLTSTNIQILFKGLSLYFLFSVVLQFLVNFTDLMSSKKELLNFAKATRSYLREDQIKVKINEMLDGREFIFWGIYLGISIIYLMLAGICWHIYYFMKIINII